MAGLRKGRRKEFGRTRARVRGRNEQVFLSFFSRDRIENLFPFRSGLPCGPKKRQQTFGIIKCAPFCWEIMWTCFDVLLHRRLFCFVRNTADTCKYMLRTKQVLFAQWTIYATLTSLGDEGDTIKWRKYKKFYFIVYYIVFLLSCTFLILTFLTVTLLPKISCISICEMKWTQGKSDKAWEDLGNEARAILVKIIYSSYKCVKVNLLKKGRK